MNWRSWVERWRNRIGDQPLNRTVLIERAKQGITWLRQGPLRRVFGYVALKWQLIRSRDLPLRVRVRHGLGLLGRTFLTGVAALFLYALILIPFTPSIKDLREARIDQPTVVLSADGKVLATYKRMNREWVPLNRISPHVVDALISTEDRRFYHHHGIDLIRTASALLHTLRGERQGGSTITQQLARNLFPDQIGREVTITRKLKELITAFKLEYAYTKDQILETYLNTVPFLYNAHGIEMAARTYFNKSAANLNVLESATLVGMLKGTAYYNPVLNPDRALARRNIVLEQMAKAHKLGNLNLARLEKQPLRLDFEEQTPEHGPAPYFAEYLRRWLVDWADRNNYNIYSDGLVVQTTIDSKIQAAARQALEREAQGLQDVADVEWGEPGTHVISHSMSAYRDLHNSVAPFSHFFQVNPQLLPAFIRQTDDYKQLRSKGKTDPQAIDELRHDKKFLHQLIEDKTRLEAGLVAVEPETGEVLAWVGGRDYDDDQYDHVDWAKRQPGSTFKPFLYAAALEQGYKPTDTFKDEIPDIALKNGEVWQPKDAEKATGRMMTLRDALIHSTNTVAAQLVAKIGPHQLARTARAMGIDRSPLNEVPSLALGTSPVSLLEITSAYGTIVNQGKRVEPVVVTQIRDKQGNILANFTPSAYQAIDPRVSLELLDMMRGVVNQGTGTGIRNIYGIRTDVAGKTGTSQNGADGWFIMLSENVVVGAWVGFDDPRVTFRSSYWGQGGHNALNIVGDFYRTAAERDLIDTDAPMPGYHQREEKEEGVLSPALNWLGDKLNSFGQALRGLGSKLGFGPAPEKPHVHHRTPHHPAPVVSPAPAPADQTSAPALPQPWQGTAPPAPATPPAQTSPQAPAIDQGQPSAAPAAGVTPPPATQTAPSADASADNATTSPVVQVPNSDNGPQNTP